MSISKKARWIIYPLLIGAIVYLILTQQREERNPVQREYDSWVQIENRGIKVIIAD